MTLSEILATAEEIPNIKARETDKLLYARARLRAMISRITKDGTDIRRVVFADFDDLVGRCRKLDEETLAKMFDEEKKDPVDPSPNDMDEILEAALGADGKENPVL
ncbi:MAG: hypothetical protein AAB495_00755 [Patescibacteria group bacterium]